MRRDGGADHIRSSLSVVLTDAAPVSTAAVASSRRHHGTEHTEAAPWHGSRRKRGCYIKNQVSGPIVPGARAPVFAFNPYSTFWVPLRTLYFGFHLALIW